MLTFYLLFIAVTWWITWFGWVFIWLSWDFSDQNYELCYFTSVSNSFQLMTAERLILINPLNFPIMHWALLIIQCEEVQKGKREKAENRSSLCIHLQGNHAFLRNSATLPYGTWKNTKRNIKKKLFLHLDYMLLMMKSWPALWTK